MKTMAMLVRREFWEHRVFLWLPLILCAGFLLTCVVVGAKFGQGSVTVMNSRGVFRDVGSGLVGLTFVLPLTVAGLMAIVTFFYLSDSLYADRKDRSILFWKSLPVSDAMTVLSKMLVALIAVPLVVYALAFVTNLLVLLVIKVSTGVELFSGAFGVGEWFGANLQLLLRIFVMALWYSPIVALQLLISVSVPRMPLVWTVVPPLVLIFGERMFFGTWNVGLFVLERISGPDTGQNVAFAVQGIPGHGLNPLPFLSHVDLWAGVAVAAVLTYVAILIRRHRSDS